MSILLRILGIEDAKEEESAESEALEAIAEALESLPPERARFYAAFAYLLARVAGADLKVEDGEVEEMQRILIEGAGIPAEEAQIVIQIAGSQVDDLGATHNYLVTRHFRQIGSEADKLRLLDCLFAVAAADDVITGQESNEIISIAQELGLGRAHALEARARFRDKLAEFRRLPTEDS